MQIRSNITDTLEAAGSRIEMELGGLLDCKLVISAPKTSMISKAQFFVESRKKMVLTRMSVSGDREGDLYVFCPLRDAVMLGGILIMLPPAELEKRIKKEDFGEEEADAFGEIANILSGDLNGAFEEYYPDKLHFKKTALEIVVPSKVKPEEAEPLPPGNYLRASFPVNLDGQELGGLELLFPAGILDLEEPAAVEPTAAPRAREADFVPAEPPAVVIPAEPEAAGLPSVGTSEWGEEKTVADGTGEVEPKPQVLVVAAEKDVGGSFVAALEGHGWQAKLVGGKENLKEIAQQAGGAPRGVFLVMETMEDQSFAVAIKVRSAFGSAVPLIAAGSEWTRTKVLQAIKYGICDILVLPASPEEIMEKVTTHFR
jgi:chemotaxis protein CheY-P-specific phosphatase CheC